MYKRQNNHNETYDSKPLLETRKIGEEGNGERYSLVSQCILHCRYCSSGGRGSARTPDRGSEHYSDMVLVKEGKQANINFRD